MEKNENEELLEQSPAVIVRRILVTLACKKSQY